MSNQEITKGEARIIDLLERIGAVWLYKETDMAQNDVAKALGFGKERRAEILKGVTKTEKHGNKESGK